jgi:hypothetical protein
MSDNIELEPGTRELLHDYMSQHKHIKDLDHAIVDAICKATVFYALNKEQNEDRCY